MWACEVTYIKCSLRNPAGTQSRILQQQQALGINLQLRCQSCLYLPWKCRLMLSGDSPQMHSDYNKEPQPGLWRLAWVFFNFCTVIHRKNVEATSYSVNNTIIFVFVTSNWLSQSKRIWKKIISPSDREHLLDDDFFSGS